jgi:hypothetical protein
VFGGESGIRTHGRLTPTAVFKTAALNHSAISPNCRREQASRGRRYGSLTPGILPFAPSGPPTLSVFASASCLRVKTAALNHSAISPNCRREQASCGRRYGSLTPGILPSAPSGPPTLSVFASASCLRVKTGFLSHSAIFPNGFHASPRLQAADLIRNAAPFPALSWPGRTSPTA